MFGFYRTLLALMVVLLHIGGIPWLGDYAVFGFYILSGYLMTYIMHRNYAYNVQGTFKYGLNRFLRIYPMYWVASLISLLLIFVLGEQLTSEYHNALVVPVDIKDIIKNIFLLFPNLETVRLTPPAWALTVELFFYVLIGLGLSKSKRVSLVWLGFGIVYHVVAWFLDMDRYFSIFAASLPFAVGACIFHFKDMLVQKLTMNQKTEPIMPLLLIVLMFINWYIGFLLTRSHEIFFYANCVLCGMMVVVLSECKTLPFISKKLDQRIGDFSYPIYLIHYQVALVVLVVSGALGFEFERPDITLMLISIPFIFMVSWFLVVMVERPIEYMRTKVRSL